LGKVLVFGNSGSGKSTLAAEISRSRAAAHLDLDTLAWCADNPTQRAPIEALRTKLVAFIDTNHEWVIEGCYTDLLELVVTDATEMIYMNLSVEACIENARRRPWEPHKYASRADQDANLDMLVEWIAQYPVRSDTFSQSAHLKLYENFSGAKSMIRCNGAWSDKLKPAVIS